MMHILGGDIGGTKTLLTVAALDERSGQQSVVFEQRLPSGDYKKFSTLLEAFFENARSVAIINVQYACFAVAGPVHDQGDAQVAKVTSLPWQLDTRQLCEQFALQRVKLINDFEAIGYGIGSLAADDLVTLQESERLAGKPCVVLGAGTGLGVCQLIHHGGEYQVVPSEGGHADFGPNDTLQSGLLTYMHQRYDHVSYDRLVSGRGIGHIFGYLVDRGGLADHAEVKRILASDDVPAAIAAAQDQLEVARETIRLFVRIYGAQAGNLALLNLAYGGVYLAGGIAPKLIDQLRSSVFLEAFRAKGRMADLMTKFPVYVVMNPKAGLLGALKQARP
jgi:glucokinase